MAGTKTVVAKSKGTSIKKKGRPVASLALEQQQQDEEENVQQQPALELPKTAGKKKAEGKKRKTQKAKADPAESAKRKTLARRAGLQYSVDRCHRRIGHSNPSGGGVSKSAAVVLAATLQFFDELILSSADKAAAIEGPNARITSAHVQTALTSIDGLKRSGLIKSSVLGAARLAADRRVEIDGVDQ